MRGLLRRVAREDNDGAAHAHQAMYGGELIRCFQAFTGQRYGLMQLELDVVVSEVQPRALDVEKVEATFKQTADRFFR